MIASEKSLRAKKYVPIIAEQEAVESFEIFI